MLNVFFVLCVKRFEMDTFKRLQISCYLSTAKERKPCSHLP